MTSQPPLTGTTFLAGSSAICQNLPSTWQDPPSGFPQATLPTLPPKLTPVIRDEVTEGRTFPVSLPPYSICPGLSLPTDTCPWLGNVAVTLVLTFPFRHFSCLLSTAVGPSKTKPICSKLHKDVSQFRTWYHAGHEERYVSCSQLMF